MHQEALLVPEKYYQILLALRFCQMYMQLALNLHGVDGSSVSTLKVCGLSTPMCKDHSPSSSVGLSLLDLKNHVCSYLAIIP